MYQVASQVLQVHSLSNVSVGGELVDGDGNFGTSGQVLSSDGTDTAWVNAGSLTAGAAALVGVNDTSANASHYVAFVEDLTQVMRKSELIQTLYTTLQQMY